MDTQHRSWASGRPANSPFAMPSGMFGRLAGRFMLWTNKQAEVLDALDVRRGDRVLEVGCGPGGLIRLLADRTEAGVVHGVDPAPAVRDVAAKANRAAIRAGRVKLGAGSAESIDLPDESVDRVVSVNTVAIWPDLEAGLRELHRVVRPGGTVLIAWHGGAAPSFIPKRLRLPEDKLARVESGLQDLFSEVGRHQLEMLDVFTATR